MNENSSILKYFFAGFLWKFNPFLFPVKTAEAKINATGV